MGISEFCIRRPVFATVLSLVIILLGVVSYSRLTVREYPNVDEPVVSVSTRYPGASAKIVESQVTQILEGSIAGIPGIDVIDSFSRSEQSRISVRFRPDVDQDVAASDVRDRVSRVRGRLPDEIDEPVVASFGEGRVLARDRGVFDRQVGVGRASNHHAILAQRATRIAFGALDADGDEGHGFSCPSDTGIPAAFKPRRRGFPDVSP